MNTAQSILEVQSLSKTFGTEVALSDISLRFSENQIYGLLGRNGAGKTTLLDILTNRLFADDGSVQWLGEDLRQNPAVIRKVCYMPEKNHFHDFRLNMLLDNGKRFFFPGLDLEYAGNLATRFELDLTKKQHRLSKGQDSIFKIIFGLASRAPVTIFDEPIIGLDAVARDLFYRELIDEYARNPRMFIISTHLIEELANAFSEVVILKNGLVHCQGAVEELLAKTFCISGKAADVDAFSSDYTVLGVESFGRVKLAVIEGSPPEDIDNTLQISTISMQKLFIYLTAS